MQSITELSPPRNTVPANASQRLRDTMAAARLSFTWLGVRKSLSTQQKNQAAGSFGAEGKYLSAGKRLLDTSHPAFKAVTGVRGRAISYWKGVSLPFPEPGIRLIRQDRIEPFNDVMDGFRRELDEAVTELQSHYDDLKTTAAERLGELYEASDYPPTLDGMFEIQNDFPSVTAPDYLRTLKPELYEEECRRVQARFDEAVQLAEQAFLEELGKLVDHLAERLQGDADGQPKIFRDSAITNLTEFFRRFGELNVRSNDQLDALVENAQALVQGVEPQRLREDQSTRELVTQGMREIQSTLDEMLIDRPRRNIQRRPR